MICNLDQGIETTTCACELLYVVYVYSLISFVFTLSQSLHRYHLNMLHQSQFTVTCFVYLAVFVHHPSLIRNPRFGVSLWHKVWKLIIKKPRVPGLPDCKNAVISFDALRACGWRTDRRTDTRRLIILEAMSCVTGTWQRSVLIM